MLCLFRVSITISCCMLLVNPQARQIKLSLEERAVVKEARKEIAKQRRNVEKAFICQRCKGSGRVIKRVKFGNRNEFSREQRQDCSDCGTRGVHHGGNVHAAMARYYALVANHPSNLRPHLENVPTLARWMIQKIHRSQTPLLFNGQWMQKKGSTKQGSAYLLLIEGIGAYQNPDSKCTIVLGKVLNTNHVVALLFFDWLPPDLKRVVSDGAPERLVVVGYSEGTAAYRSLLDGWKNEIENLRLSGSNPYQAERRREVADALSAALKALSQNGHLLTAAEAIRVN